MDASVQDTEAETSTYYCHAVEKHGDLHDTDLDADRENTAGRDNEDTQNGEHNL